MKGIFVFILFFLFASSPVYSSQSQLNQQLWDIYVRGAKKQINPDKLAALARSTDKNILDTVATIYAWLGNRKKAEFFASKGVENTPRRVELLLAGLDSKSVEIYMAKGKEKTEKDLNAQFWDAYINDEKEQINDNDLTLLSTSTNKNILDTVATIYAWLGNRKKAEFFASKGVEDTPRRVKQLLLGLAPKSVEINLEKNSTGPTNNEKETRLASISRQLNFEYREELSVMTEPPGCRVYLKGEETQFMGASPLNIGWADTFKVVLGGNLNISSNKEEWNGRPKLETKGGHYTIQAYCDGYDPMEEIISLEKSQGFNRAIKKLKLNKQGALSGAKSNNQIAGRGSLLLVAKHKKGSSPENKAPDSRHRELDNTNSERTRERAAEVERARERERERERAYAEKRAAEVERARARAREREKAYAEKRAAYNQAKDDYEYALSEYSEAKRQLTNIQNTNANIQRSRARLKNNQSPWALGAELGSMWVSHSVTQVQKRFDIATERLNRARTLMNNLEQTLTVYAR